MTVSANPARKVITGAGWSNPLSFAIYIESSSHIEVWADDTLLALGTDYTVAGVADPAGFEVTILSPSSYADVDKWVLLHKPPLTQGADISLGGAFGLTYENAIDAMTRRIQAVDERAQRALKLPLTSDGTEDFTDRVPIGRADGSFEVGPAADEISAAAAEAAAAAASAAAALVSQNAAADSATSASTSATNAGNSATAAAASASAAATSATAAAGSATNAGNSETAAAASAASAATSETNAGNSATAAAGSASSASTSATNAGNSATAAAASAAAAAADAASVVPFRYNTQAAAAAATISASTDFILVGDDLYQRVSASHPRLGPELISNGDFSNPASFVESGDAAVWNVAGGIATSVAGGAAFLIQNEALANGDRVFVQFDVLSVTAGGVRSVFGGSNTLGSNHSTVGTKSDVLTATAASSSIGLYSSGFSGTCDNISAKKLPADAFSSNGGTVWWARVTGDTAVALSVAETAAAARTTLGLGSAALLTAGDASGNLKALNADGGFTFATTATSVNIAGNFGGTWVVGHRKYSSDTATFAGSRATEAIMREVTGSGTNGPDRADYGLHVEAWKTSYLTSAVQGEVDGMNIVVRQGELGDTSALLFNTHKVESASYGQTGLEGLMRWVQATTGTVLRDFKVTMGANIPGTDLRSGGSGFTMRSTTGSTGGAFNALSDAGTTIARVLTASSSLLAANTYFEITGNGHADGSGLLRAGAGLVTKPALTFVGDDDTGLYSASANVLGIATGGTVRMLVGPGVRIGAGLTDPGAGILNVLTSISINGTKVIGARDTGWTAMTGTAAKGTFDTETMTTLQCARKLKALTDALTTHGVIGA